MKEIKAYIRCSAVERVIQALHKIGVENLTVIDVMALGKGMIDPDHYKYSIECVEKYSSVAKIEIICADKDTGKIIETVQTEAYSGEKGDGVIFVSNISRAIKIRTGERGENVLQPEIVRN
ncbi:MAG: P-II family nitrogen regulator [Fidelibacterota bacterium]